MSAADTSPLDSNRELHKALQECAREKIQIPGTIQPNGVLFCVEKKSLQVLQCSANVEDILGIPVDTALSMVHMDVPPTLRSLLGLTQEQVENLYNHEFVDFTLSQKVTPTETHSLPVEDEGPPESMKYRKCSTEFTAFCSPVPSPSTSHQWFGDLSSSNYDENIQLVIIEIEPCCEDKEQQFYRNRVQQKSVQRLSRRLASTNDVLEACRVAAEEVRVATGFDRVMVYEFDREWHGEILVEVTAKNLPQLYLGLRFPAGDIPPQARHLYTKNPFRIISDTFYTPCPIIPTINPLTKAPLDMSLATFRAVSPVHIQYLKNIEVGASMSISILINDTKKQQKKLFGLVVCHNNTPKFLNYDVRETCVVMGQMISLRVENLLYNKFEEKRLAMKDIINAIATTHHLLPNQPDINLSTDLTINIDIDNNSIKNTTTTSTTASPNFDDNRGGFHYSNNSAYVAASAAVTSVSNAAAAATAATNATNAANAATAANANVMTDDIGSPKYISPRAFPDSGTQSPEGYTPTHPFAPLALGFVQPEHNHESEILQLFGADYGLIVVQGMRRMIGPPMASEVVFVAAFEQYIASANPSHIFYSNCISKSIPQAIPVANGYETSGVLYVPLALDASSYLALFRFEQVTHVKWAGAPEKKLDIHPVTNRPTLVPRTSFQMWTEEVRGRSRQWSELEVETAQSLCVNLMELMRLIKLRVQMVEDTITQQRLEWEKNLAEQSNKMKSQFLANLSHEVRTPLNAIIGMVDLTLATTTVDPIQASYLAAVQHASESLLLIINDLLDISKIESGKMVILDDTFELGRLTEQTVSAYRMAFEHKGIAFLFYIEPTISGPVTTDSVRLCQVLTNLLSNAQKYTTTGSVEVKVYPIPQLTQLPSRKASPKRLHPPTSPTKEDLEYQRGREEADALGEKTYVHFSIRDTGIGIPTEKLDIIFEPFEQVDNSLTRKAGGTGLGLSICRRIVRLMGGQLWCESEVNSGSHFHFEIPVGMGAVPPIRDANLAPTSTGTDYTGPNANFSNPSHSPGPRTTYDYGPSDIVEPQQEPSLPKVLVVEDNILNQKVIINLLRRLHIMCDVAANGEMAVSMYRDQPSQYAAILMDICMPVMDGLVATREIRAIECQLAMHGTTDTRRRSASNPTHQRIFPQDAPRRTTLSDPLRTRSTSEGATAHGVGSSGVQRVPIVALSAQVMDQDREACVNVGMDGFLEKPVRFENLRNLLSPIYSKYPTYKG